MDQPFSDPRLSRRHWLATASGSLLSSPLSGGPLSGWLRALAAADAPAAGRKRSQPTRERTA